MISHRTDNGGTAPLEGLIASCRCGFVAAGTFSLFINLLVLTTSVYMLQVYDRVLSGRSLETLVYLTLMATIALAVMGVLELVRSRILIRIGTWFDRVLSPQVLDRSIENALQGKRYRVEALRDVATLRNYLGGAGILSLFDAPWMPIYLAFIFLLHPVLGFLALGGGLALFALALLNNALTTPILAKANAAVTANLEMTESALRNAEVVDALGMGQNLGLRWERANANILEQQRRASDLAAMVSAATKPLRMLLQIGVLGLGAWLVLRHELTAGAMIAASIIMSRALAPVEQAIATWKQTTSAREAWRRLSAMFETAPLHPGTMALPKPQGRLSVENLSFVPNPSARPILSAVSFALEPGEVLALIGPSAAGKSTLARLLIGIAAPTSGHVRLDGGEIFARHRNEIGPHIGYLPQDVELFRGTVRENIARMGSGPPEDVVAAARMAGVHDMILRLPNGYETEIGDQGSKLSGGQRQRIGLARALYGVPSLLVLDEPNSNLDAEGEEALNSAIAEMKSAGSTVVIIAHRPSMLAHVDKVLVLVEGQVRKFGQRDAVLAEMRRPERPVAVPQVRVVSSGREAS